MKKVYLVRHCETVSQDQHSPLTEKGFEQASELASFFTSMNIETIISSPFLRAIQSIGPHAQSRNLEVITDERLSERVLNSIHLPDWYDTLRETFIDFDRTYEGGESSREAMHRIVEAIEEILHSDDNNVIVVTHGNVLALLLHYYDDTFGFEQWRLLGNPDVFVLEYEEDLIQVRNVWKKR